MKDMVWNRLKVSMKPSERHGLESAISMGPSEKHGKYIQEPSERHGLDSAKSRYGTK